jgi:ribonucleoside-diphosphate reductase alpha chain
MKIRKRDNRLEQLSFDKIIYRLRKLCNDEKVGVLTSIDPDLIAQRVVSSIYDGITSQELDEEAARIAISMTDNFEYSKLASRIIVSNLHKSTNECFSEVMEVLYNNKDKSGGHAPIIADDVIEFVRSNKNVLNFAIDYTRDYLFDYFGFKTLEKSYLMKVVDINTNKSRVVERPQHMYMRVAIGVHKNDIDNILKTYHLISQHYYTHASPTLFNASSRLAALSSCYLMGSEDSIEGIYKTITDCGRISKLGGGIGVHISNIRAKGSVIRKTNGTSDGIIPMIKVYNETARYVNQSSRRKGSFSLYLEPWHADILEFLELKRNQGHEEMRARDLFYAIWTPDLFMKQVEDNGDWYLMCPDESPGLTEVYGDEFEKLYWKYVEEKKYRKVVKAQEVWRKIMDSQIETGVPYIGYKDAVNKKCNQKNLGTIKSSNLCLEISLHSDDKEYAVCFTGDTKVLTKDGYKRINKCDNAEVASFFNNDIELKECLTYNKAQLIDNGLKEVYQLDCYGTKPIKATSNHLFLTVLSRKNRTNTYQWKKLGDLKENDKILLPNTDTLPSYDVNGNYEEEYLSTGWMLGDGWQSLGKSGSTYGVCFGPTDIHARDRVTKCLSSMVNNCAFKKMGNRQSTPDCYEDKNGVFNWSSKKICFVDHIKEQYGLYEHTAHHKVIPEKIKHSTPNQIRSFLSGLFSADGTVYIKNNETSAKFYVALSSASKHLLYDTQELLRCFGIESRIVYTYAITKENYQGHLRIEPIQSIKSFAQYINFELCPAKKNKLSHGLETIQKRDVYRQFAKVKSVTYHGVERVYDLSVPTTHNFIAEGQVVHNCNLASVALPKYVEYDAEGKPFFNHQKLYKVSKYIITPMNKVIDNNYYPTEETQKSNMAHRPLGIGIQGLADVYIKMRMPFESKEATQLNKEIFETLYFGCLSGSVELAKKDGPYQSFEGSPFSQGLFQFDLAEHFDGVDKKRCLSGRWDWDSLRADLVKYGARNSMLTALMPTASTAQIMGNSEAFEPYDSCIFKRRVLSGEYLIINKYLIADLIKLGLWSKEMKEKIIAHDGSIQAIDEIPDDLKAIYKTVWEVSMKSVIEQASDRGLFVDQMQSMNLFMANPNYKKLTSMHFYAWKNHLKSGMYYLRSKSSASAGKFSIDASLEKKVREKKAKGKPLNKTEENLLCSIDNKDECLMCSS